MTTSIEQFLTHINKRVNMLELEIQKLQSQRRALSEARIIPFASRKKSSDADTANFRKAA